MGRGGRIPPPTFDPLQRMGTALPIPPPPTPLLVWQHQTPLQNSAPSPLCPTTLPIKGRRGKGEASQQCGEGLTNEEEGRDVARCTSGRTSSPVDSRQNALSQIDLPKTEKNGRGENIRGPPYVLPLPLPEGRKILLLLPRVHPPQPWAQFFGAGCWVAPILISSLLFVRCLPFQWYPLQLRQREKEERGGGVVGEGREEAVISEQRNLPFLLLLFGGGWVSRGKKEARGDLFP